MRYISFFIAVCVLAWTAAEVRPQATNAATMIAPSRSVLKGSSSSSSQLRSGNLLIPVAGIVQNQLRNTFNESRGGGRVHQAIDILAPHGTPVIAAVDGKIRKLFNSKAGGITIYQADAADEKMYYYAHLARYADGLREGQFVSRGDVIGYVGTTGNARSTPHLHFAINILPPTKEWWKGEPIDPYPLLTQGGGSSPVTALK